MFNPKLLLALTFVAGAIAQTAFAQPANATATTISRSSSYPPVGLALSETMQVNVSNLAENPTTVTATSPAASCVGSISFFNAAGTAIGTATAFTLTAGETQSVPLTLAKAGISGSRAEVRAVIQSTIPQGRNTPPCSLASSLETFDSGTGVTHVYVSNGATPVSPSPGLAAILTGTFAPNF